MGECKYQKGWTGFLCDQPDKQVEGEREGRCLPLGSFLCMNGGKDTCRYLGNGTQIGGPKCDCTSDFEGDLCQKSKSKTEVLIEKTKEDKENIEGCIDKEGLEDKEDFLEIVEPRVPSSNEDTVQLVGKHTVVTDKEIRSPDDTVNPPKTLKTYLQNLHKPSNLKGNESTVNLQGNDGTVNLPNPNEGTDLPGSAEKTENLPGSIENTENLSGSIENTENLSGSTENTENLSGSIENTENLPGSTDKTENLPSQDSTVNLKQSTICSWLRNRLQMEALNGFYQCEQ